MSIAAAFAAAPVGWVAYEHLVFRVRRVCTDDLRRVGHAELEGSEAYTAVRQQLERELTEAQIAAGQHESDEARAAAVARVAQVRETRAIKRLQAMVSTPAGQDAMLARADAYLCAALDGVAEGETWAAEPTVHLAEPPLRTAWEPWRWVRTEAEESAEEGRVAIGRWPTAVREVVGLTVIGLLQGVTRRRVDPFPPGRRPAPESAPAGGDLRSDAGGGDEVAAGRARARRGVPRAAGR